VTHQGCFAKIAELERSLAIAKEALEKIGPKWLYWPAPRQPDPRVIMYESRTIKELEDMAADALTKINCPSGLEDDT